jgi:hypothetical protein
MKFALRDKIRQNSYLYFLCKLFVFTLLVFILDLSLGSILKYYYFKQSSGFLYRTTYSMEETTAELLIFGSSKANHQYHPDVFEKRLKLSYYNVGHDGSSIFYHYAILKSVLKRYSPKMIILDITREFEKNQESYDRISMLYPYYQKHPEIRPIIEVKSPYEKLKFVSKIFPYNSLLFTIISGNMQFNKERHRNIKGYVPLLKKWNNPIQTDSAKPSYDVDSIKIKIFESFINDCNRCKVKLYVVHSPDFIIKKYDEKSNVAGKEIAHKYHVKLLEHYQDSLFLNNSKYFSDVSHLNEEGAIVFSNIIIDEIARDNQIQVLK